MTNPSEYTLAQAADPSTPAALLGEIATHRPDLRPAVAANPTAYPELLDWLRSFGDPAVDAALAARGAGLATPAAPQVPPAPAVQGYPAQQDWSQQGQATQAGYSSQPVAQDPAQTQQLPTGPAQGTYGFTPEQAGQPAGQWAGQQAGAAAPQGTDAWGQPVPSGQLSQPGQPAPNGAWGQPQPAAKKSRKGLWITVGVVGALVVGGGAFAANALWFSKVGGAASPEAAATQLIEAAVAKDLVGVYGVTSPSEFDNMSTAFTLFSDHLKTTGDFDAASMTDAYKDYFDAFDLELADLEVEVEDLEDGLAKVSIVGGQLTIDADADKVSAATITLLGDIQDGPLSELLDMSGTPMPSDDEVREAVTGAVEETFPVDVTAADLQLDPSEIGATLGVDLGTEPIDPFLIVVQEGGDWYVSPTLTMLEYATMTQGIERGSMPSEDLAGQYDTPEAAAEGLVTGLKEYLETGDQDAYLSALPLADRRAMTLYGTNDLSELDGYAEIQEALAASDLTATFSVREEKDGVAWLQVDSLTFSSEYQGTAASVELDAECFSADVDGEQIKGCLDDIPALKELGIGDLSLIAIEEDGSWYISYAATTGDASGVLVANALRLFDEGKLADEQWWIDNLGVLGDQLF